MVEDVVNKPKHYQLWPGVEVIDVRRALLDKVDAMPVDKRPTAFQLDCWSRAWEYLTRCWGKNDIEDMEKALVYLGWLVEDRRKMEHRLAVQGHRQPEKKEGDA